ncbi:MAG: HAD family hydrolase [Burkholderiaceae bacterium]
MSRPVPPAPVSGSAGPTSPSPLHDVRAVCFDWGGTLMTEDGPDSTPMSQWPTVRAVPGAPECLAALSGRVPLAIATNASVSRRPMIEKALHRVGMREHFSQIFCYTELGYRKSQREFWDVVANELGQPLERIAMIGDSFEQDADYPRRFGVQGVWFNENGAQPSPDESVPMVTALDRFARWVIAALPADR